MKKKPNIIIIMTDQQRADLRKSEGFPCDTMPFLDSMALKGQDFSRAYTPTPICFPARNSLFTGRYPGALNTTSNNSGQADILYRKDMLELLKEEGYKTALCGKNHSFHSPKDFDYAFQTGHGGGQGPDRSEEEVAFDTYLTGLKHLTDPKPTPFPVELQGPYRDVTKSLEWIDGLKKSTAADSKDSDPDSDPFFLWLSFAEPHNPFQVPEPYFSLFEDAPEPLTGKEDLVNKGYKYRWMRKAWESAIPDFDENVIRTRKNYLGMLRLIDDQLKRFIGGLEKRGLTGETYIFFTSDHGDFAGDLGLIRKGPELPEVLCRIPMVITGPEVKPNPDKMDSFVNLVDIFPTVCDLIGLEIPEGVQGRSFADILRGLPYPAQEFRSAYGEHGFGGLYYDGSESLSMKEEGALNDGCYLDELNTWTQCGTARMVRMDDYKMVFDMMGTGQLYNIIKDPLELNNLYGQDKYREIQLKITEELMKWTFRAADNGFNLPRRYRYKRHEKNYMWDKRKRGI
jgi:arylsulfatase A-like enzyme